MYFSSGEKCYLQRGVELASKIDGSTASHRVLTIVEVIGASDDGSRYTLRTVDGDTIEGVHVMHLIPITTREYLRHSNPARRIIRR